jgi:hypothetical protein
VQRRNQLQATFYAQNQAAHGILMRLEALSQLSSGNLTVGAARLLLFLLFLVIECLPVTVKLLQRPGQYEAALREAKKAEQRDYEKFFSTRSRLRQAGLSPAGRARAAQAGPAQPLPAQGAPFAGEPQPDPIWNRTRRMPTVLETPDDDTPTEVFEDPGPGRGSGLGYGPPQETARPGSHWRGADAWRNHWSSQDQDDLDGDDRRAAHTRRDPFVAATRVDYGFADEVRDERYRRPDGHDPADADHEPIVPALEAAGDDDDSMPARAEGNGGGIPLSWDDE